MFSLTQLINKAFSSTINAIRVTQIGGLMPPEGSDCVTRIGLAPTIDEFSYRQGGVSGAILGKITVTYTTSKKREIVSAVKT